MGRPRTDTLQREDIAMILELRSEGIKWSYIAHYGYGLTINQLRGRMQAFGV